jgi:hypothetical protein
MEKKDNILKYPEEADILKHKDKSKKQPLPTITVEKVPNGYVLKFDGMKKREGFLYFSPEKLLEGFMLHIGLHMTDELDTDMMQDFIVGAINYSTNEKCIKEIERLNAELNAVKRSRNGMGRRVIEERTRLLKVIDIVEELEIYTKKENRTEYNNLRKRLPRVKPLTLEELGISIEAEDNDEVEEEELARKQEERRERERARQRKKYAEQRDKCIRGA